MKGIAVTGDNLISLIIRMKNSIPREGSFDIFKVKKRVEAVEFYKTIELI